MGRTEVRCRNAYWMDTIDLLVLNVPYEGQKFYAEPLTMKPLDQGSIISQPTLSLRNDEAQLLMDELWRCGLRPTEGSGSAGSLAATEKHLQDMQAITRGLLAKSGVVLDKPKP